jgi:hypothetical protein
MNDVVNKKENTQGGREPARSATPTEGCAPQPAAGRDVGADISEFLTRRKHRRTGLFLPSGLEGGD